MTKRLAIFSTGKIIKMIIHNFILYLFSVFAGFFKMSALVSQMMISRFLWRNITRTSLSSVLILWSANAGRKIRNRRWNSRPTRKSWGCKLQTGNANYTTPFLPHQFPLKFRHCKIPFVPKYPECDDSSRVWKCWWMQNPKCSREARWRRGSEAGSRSTTAAQIIWPLLPWKSYKGVSEQRVFCHSSPWISRLCELSIQSGAACRLLGFEDENLWSSPGW